MLQSRRMDFFSLWRATPSIYMFLFLEGLGVLFGGIAALCFEVMLIPHFLRVTSSDLIVLLILLQTVSIYCIVSFGAVFSSGGFLKFFCIGVQIFTFAELFYRLVKMGFSGVYLGGFVGNLAFTITVIFLMLFLTIRTIWRFCIGLTVKQVPGVYGVAKFDPDDNFGGKFNNNPKFFFATVRTKEELAVITEASIFLPGYVLVKDLLLFEIRVKNRTRRSSILSNGILSALSCVSVPYFSVSTCEGEYLLFDGIYLKIAKYAWMHSGIRIVTGD